MIKTGSTSSPSYITSIDRKRRKREIGIIFAILIAVGLLTYAESRIIQFGADFPISNTILMFILININLLLLILLLFLVFRNLVKLLYDRKRKVMGAKLRTRLVLAFITLSLMPTTVLFFFSINFINTSIEFWFSLPVEQALENSLQVGQSIYAKAEENHLFFLKKISSEINKKQLLSVEKKETISLYLQQTLENNNLHAIEVYTNKYSRIAHAIHVALKEKHIPVVPADRFQKVFTPKEINTFFETVTVGELIRTLCTVPFGVVPEKATGFVVLSTLIPSSLSEKMDSISRGYEGYQQTKLLQRPIEITYYISLSIVGLLVVFCAVWFGFYLAKTISIPIKELSEGTRKVADGDLSFSIGAVGDDEIGSLVNSFNKMTRDLRDSREKLELSARMLQTQNMEIEEKRQYMEIVLRFVSTGVMTFDANGTITTMNKSAEKMLNLNATGVLNKNIRELLSGEHLRFADEVIDQLATARDGALEFPTRVTVNGRSRSFLLNANALTDDTGRPLGTVVVFDDLTTLEKAQRMAAWREVARRIAHEVKNPLTPITLSAQRLQRRYSERLQEPVFQECTQMIIDHVALIRNLVNEFSTFARFPDAHPAPCALIPIIEETIALYREGHESVHFETFYSDNIPLLNLDRQQIKQAMINLVDNAIAAIRSNGIVKISVTHDPILKRVRLEVADNGPGIPDDEKVRLFEPYFSTKTAGMGLGLTIVNSIFADHSGVIRVQDNHPRGAKFVVELPV
jgi:two-component system, NtrC family, nitrogen regulation sensor histidine kinase NtrY